MPDRDGTLNMNPDHSLAAALRALPDAAPQPDLWPALARALDERVHAAPAVAKRENAEPGAPNAHAPDAGGSLEKTQGCVIPAKAGIHSDVRNSNPDPGFRRDDDKLAGYSRFRGGKLTGSRILRFIPLALAAGVALAVLLPSGLIRRATPDRTPAVAGTTPAAMPNVIAGSAAAPAGELDSLHRRSQTLERWIAAVAARAPQDSRDLMAAVEVEDLIGLIDVQLGAEHDRADALPLWRQRVALLEDLATIRGSAYAIAANDDGAPHAVNASLNRIN
jgi:hypothetical protein